MMIPSINAAIAYMGIGDVSLEDAPTVGGEAAPANSANSLLEKIDTQWSNHQSDVVNAFLARDKSTASSLQLEIAALNNKLFVDAFSTMTGNLMKSVSRLEQING